MDWLNQHVTELLAVLGALYTAARIIVALTPTPRDDAAIANINVFVVTLAKAFGLDLKQGLKSGSNNTGSGSVKTPIILMLVCMLTGCVWHDNPRADLLASQKVFASTVRSLTVAYEAGKIKSEDATKATALIHEGNDFLLQWETEIANGVDSDITRQAFKYVMMKLLQIDAAYSKGTANE